MAVFPNNNFSNDQLDVDQFGGSPKGSTVFDTIMLLYITGLLRSVASTVLANVRVSWVNGVCTVQNGVGIGDVLAMDMSTDRIDPTTQVPLPPIDKYSTILANGGIPVVIGVSVMQAAAGAKCQYAAGGLVPASITGLIAMTGGALVAVDATTNKLRAWTSTDEALGQTSPRGNVALFALGRVSA